MDTNRNDAKLRRAINGVVTPLERLVAEMGRYEPGLGMAEAEFIEGDDNHMQVRFRARPVAVSFVNNSRKITVTITPTDETKPLE